MTDITMDSALFQQAADALPHGLVISDMRQAGQPIIYANPAFLALTGYPLDEVLGRNCNFLQNIATDSDTVQEMIQAIRGHKSFSGKILNYKKDGSTFWNQLSMSPIFDENNLLTHYVGIQTDISELVSTQHKLNTLIEQDYVTGVANRRALVAFFKNHIKTTPSQPLRVSLLTIQNLKPIEDTHGHIARDELLKAVSGRLIHVIKPGELVARFGEDTFVLLTRENTNQSFEQRITHINDPYKAGSVLLPNVNISIGSTTYPTAGQDLDDLIALASKAA